MKWLLLLLLMSAVGSARAATLSGDVTCEGCGSVAVRLVLGPSPFGPPLYTVTLDAAGPWSVPVSNGTGLVGVYAFEDLDGDGEPDPGAVVAGYPANPIDIGTEDIAGIDLTVTPASPPSVTVSGTLTCPGCEVVRVRVSAQDSPLFPIREVPLESGGAWSVEVPRDVGTVWVFGTATEADDAWVAFAGNPLAIGESDVTGVELTLVAPRTQVVVSGTITCPSCEAGVVLEVRADDEVGPVVVGEVLAAPGAFAASLPIDFGPVALVAYRDDDGDGVADADAAPGPYAANPVSIAQDDIGGLALVVPEAGGDAVQVSGTVACPDCVGVGVTLRLGDALGPAFAGTALTSGSGAWAVELPAGLGLVGVLAFRDDDRDGMADEGQPVGEYAQNPLDVGTTDVTGLALSVPAKVVTAVTVSGTIVCADCAGGVGVRVHLGEVDGPLFTLVVLGGAGPFVIVVPLDLGEVALVAFRDDDLDGLPDVGASEAAYAENPLTVAASDVSGVTLTLPAGGAATVTISGRVECDDCADVGVIAVGEDGATLARVLLSEPGSFTFVLPRDAGAITLSAYRDDDGDLLPDGGALVAYPENPIVVGGDPVVGIVIDLTPGAEPDPGPEEPPESASEEVTDDDTTEVVDATGDADAVTEPEPDVVAEPEPDVVAEPEPDVVAEPEPDVVAEPEPDVVAEPEPDVVAEPEPDVVAEPEPDVVAEPEPDVVAEPEPDVVAETVEVVERHRKDDGGCSGGGAATAAWSVLALLARAARRRSRSGVGERNDRGRTAKPPPRS